MLVAGVAVRVRAFRFGVIFVLPKYFAIYLHARGLPPSVIFSSGDAIFIAGVLIDPTHLEPVPGICLVGRDQVKPFGTPTG